MNHSCTYDFYLFKRIGEQFKRNFKVIFTFGCFFLTTYMANTQFIRWYQNEDTSLIEFKRFNLSPNDGYPSISICFTGHEFYWYNDDSIFRAYGVTAATYEKMLKGEEGFAYDYNFTSKLYTKFQLENKSLLVKDVEKFQIDVSNVITETQYVNQKNHYS